MILVVLVPARVYEMSWEALESPQKAKGIPGVLEGGRGLKCSSTIVPMTALLKFRALLVPVGLDSSPISWESWKDRVDPVSI